MDPDLCFVAEVGKRPAAISISLPDMNQVAKRMKGRLLPFSWWYLLRRRHYVDRRASSCSAWRPSSRTCRWAPPSYARTFDVALAKGYRGGEASLILENNVRMRGALEKMGATIEKTYRSYELDFAVGSQAATNEGVAG
ncbi:MAG: hypothetical protein R3E53_12800 [Myxococcota bacterium]